MRDSQSHAALVYDGAACIGWCQFGPVEELPRIKHQRACRDGLAALPDWRISCFFVDRSHRRRGRKLSRGPAGPLGLVILPAQRRGVDV
ncbi:hypothetical protein KXR53_09415 [Inquilinus limosus]|uniref:hypothetical protein n=1 Tax=Inquilinus limosus TaxID=171674 RepID=UPI003F16848C